ncbi:MAG: preprotein translocase subunit SecG [Candidatus Yanofskybacteria bacterium RIFCSPHIGHO2_02_FULL_38_22b]|uniref:Protein-export membrane protein SecG n=1 Tax=Candidatus Yanofskybacteria bacterium RIFCSPHIGHO2_02_FULL_38_22b TaxID=1802673 RepID=A0A1F8F3G5_9BACT|nr:MAG: preprotein translocase subunit SecG [Candidatus Yanofskybacteria bacterium RIFCSPHIGHO2_02_FULL_38_22b]OGN20309.1 MAG: preprotein translocase subunit SecG [Candidatus Yanofskybacteria bacterium RIFCSPLOWO2_01_FULL_39_28]
MLTYAHILISVLLIAGILLQQRGGGLSSTFGGGMMEYSTKRGAEKGIFYATIVLAVLFLSISVARLLL